MKIYDDWFEKNKYKSKEVFEKAEFELNATDINAETEANGYGYGQHRGC